MTNLITRIANDSLTCRLPRRLIARILRRPVRPSMAGQAPALVRAGRRIRTSAVALEV